MITRGPAGLLMAALAIFGGCTSDLSPVQSIQPPASIRIADSEPQELPIEAPGDAPLMITLTARDVDIRAAIMRTDQAVLHYADAPNRRMGIETLLVEPPHAGVLTLRIERHDHREARGTVEVRVIALPAVTPDDRKRVEAARLEAAACLSYSDIAQGESSAQDFANAANLYDELGEQRQAGIALLHAAGVRYTRLADWGAAAKLAKRATQSLEKAGASAHAAFSLRVEGSALDMVANSNDLNPEARRQRGTEARKLLARAAVQLEAHRYIYEAGYALNYLGVSYYETGDRDLARAEFHNALQRFEMANDRPAQALSLQSLAYLAYEDGRLSDAMSEFDAALALIPRDEERENYAHTLHNSAHPFQVLGQFDEAISRFYRAGQILRELGDKAGDARALHGMGVSLFQAGETDRARELLQAAVSLRKEIGVRREQAISLIALGLIERDAGGLNSAIALHTQAAELVSSPSDRAKALLALAQDHLAAGDRRAARKELTGIMQLDLPASHRHRGLALVELGVLEALDGHSDASRTAFAHAIAVHEKNGSELELARALQRRADVKLGSGDMSGVLEDTERALRLFDSIGLAGTHAESRAAFRSSYRGAVELRITALLRNAESARMRGDSMEAQRQLRAAFTASDRSRAHLLTDDANPFTTGSMPADLHDRQRALYALLAGKRQRHESLLDSEKPDGDEIAALAKGIALLRTEAALLEGQVSQHLARTSGGARATDDDWTATVPDDVRVAEYFIGDRHAWLFEVLEGEVFAYPIQDIDRLRQLARQLHESWRLPPRAAGDRHSLGRSLGQIVFAPLTPSTRRQSLLIVPDGPLYLVPMAVLAQQTRADVQPGEAVVIPSVRAVYPGRARQSNAPEQLLAVVADPVYSSDDPRLRSRAAGSAPDTAAVGEFLTRSASRLDSMQRLPATAAEAREIVGFAESPAKVLELVGFNASRSRIESSPLGQFRILHFATHALADTRDPALAMLALSRWDEAGNAVDGALRAHDISQWRLNADLVVLSGCDTAVGREIGGEGPLGLSHAFLRSGARSVVATLWQVPDSSTAVLMREFYRQLVVHKRDTATALQLAQDFVRRQPKWADPYYWAGFQLVSMTPIPIHNQNVARRGE